MKKSHQTSKEVPIKAHQTGKYLIFREIIKKNREKTCEKVNFFVKPNFKRSFQIFRTEIDNRDSAQFKKSILQRYLNDSVESVMAAANAQDKGCSGKASAQESTLDCSKRESIKDSILPPTSIYTSSSSTIASKDDLITQPPKLSWPPPQAGAPASMPLPGMLPWFPVPPPIMHYLHSSGKSSFSVAH